MVQGDCRILLEMFQDLPKMCCSTCHAMGGLQPVAVRGLRLELCCLVVFKVQYSEHGDEVFAIYEELGGEYEAAIIEASKSRCG